MKPTTPLRRAVMLFGLVALGKRDFGFPPFMNPPFINAPNSPNSFPFSYSRMFFPMSLFNSVLSLLCLSYKQKPKYSEAELIPLLIPYLSSSHIRPRPK